MDPPTQDGQDAHRPASRRVLLFAATLAIALATACQSEEPAPAPTPTAASATPRPADTSAPTPSPVPTASPGGIDTPVPTDEQQIEFVRSKVAEAMPAFDVTQITGVRAQPGVLTVETAWDAARTSEAKDLCEQVARLQLSTATHAVIAGQGGVTLAECDEQP